MSKALLKDVLKYLKKSEWSDFTRGQGSGPMGSGGDGYQYESCPSCGQLKQRNGEFIESAVGHKKSCKLKNLISRLEKK